MYSRIAAANSASRVSIFCRSMPDSLPSVMETIACACSSERLKRFCRLAFAVGVSAEARMMEMISSM